MQCIALGAFEMAAIQAAVLFQMSDHRLYRLPSFDPAPLPPCQRLGLAAMQDLHQGMAQVDLVLQTRTKQLIGRQLLGGQAGGSVKPTV
ncbi:hypothetical protein LA21_01850 [Xanthomonas oryzae pv. oryzae]|nr:hypothetical protein LA21_01850 [Xanthomonas oryzae pv. oryzae]